METLTCTKCKIEKPLSEFSKDRSRKTGFQSQCKACQKQYYEKNKDNIAEYQKQYREENGDKILVRNKRFYKQNKEKYLAWVKQYREQNKEKVAARKKQYYEKNKEKVLACAKQYREQNKEKIAEYHKSYGKQYTKTRKETVTDAYIKMLLAKHSTLSRKDIPQWLIDFKRAEIQHKRAIEKGIK